MSRIGKSPIAIPSGVEVTIAQGNVTVKGSKGTLSRPIPGDIIVRKEESIIFVERPNDERDNRALHGLTRTLVANMVEGVTTGFVKELEIVGVGYRAEPQGDNKLRLALGFSLRCIKPPTLSWFGLLFQNIMAKPLKMKMALQSAAQNHINPFVESISYNILNYKAVKIN